MSTVSSVISVTWILNKSFPAQLQVTAHGMASSPNWSKLRLESRVYVAPPSDGIQDFDFIGEPPTGNALTVMTGVSASGDIEHQPWMKGVRVHASTNSETVVF
ncbi:hypothetical protein [Acidovorax sp. 1608163]|uniref:hypothetical protein n=1 Tax=Acidovorax sp. 1608163 TaxID=2478662 RepID=UPI0013CEEB80|nr:hypothetical protein [Acidovorax sp. 1608163]